MIKLPAKDATSLQDNDDVPTHDLSSRKADEVDLYVGRRVKERRMMLGLSQSDLAEKVGVSHQQGHKYESGMNRISAGRLSAIANVLKVAPAWFFAEYQTYLIDSATPKQKKMLLELIRNFSLITDPQHQDAISKLARALAATPYRP